MWMPSCSVQTGEDPLHGKAVLAVRRGQIRDDRGVAVGGEAAQHGVVNRLIG
ncbi:hypothetical protein AB0M45_27825 [Nocardia sp. NPDC051787]|uniref:hypothetical protein n=1 Tax=Nocardia sp. NPDC051787 TaxID=3155415 RepID=UPI0034376F43